MASNGRFSVKQMTKVINEKTILTNDAVRETLRNNLVSKKLEIFVWRAMKKRLPVMIELDKRGIDLHSIRCAVCDDDFESVEHSLDFCKHSLEVWHLVCGWWDLGNFPNRSVNEILRDNILFSTSYLGKQIWQAVEWAAPIALNEIQLKSYEWIANSVKGVKIDWLTWLSNPKIYLNI
ncbi:uncharacterized protein [Rutidosis leptorrhynchoides]|uniref:uncharacterized protein n=1 Tax=Rutidosis leptorrhynchoides TaxID=125765 RepID=UPI003A991410